jgi:exopolyphosphatase / guanosine-5'-triphosphate,3'-diphosphate pyrophosphatase
MFAERFGAAERRLASLATAPAEVSDEQYLLGLRSEASVKIRDGLMDVKRLERVDDHGLEQWRPLMKAAFPLARTDVVTVIEALGASADLARSEYTFDELVGEVLRPRADVLVLGVHKERVRFTVGGCMAELSELRTEHGAARTVAVESEDPDRVIAAVGELGLVAPHNVSVPRKLKALAGFAARRYAVIDVGTNSVKFHIGERAADGGWRTIVDRADVTRLGQDMETTGRLGADAIHRTAQAIAGMAEEAARNDVESIVAVGTAGLRVAPNRDELIDAVRHVHGIDVEVIPGDEEARLAFLATASELDVGDGAIVVFDTGGGSSQFTIGRGTHVEERFSVNVGAVRYMERFGLDGFVDQATLTEALDAITADLARLDDRLAVERVVGMGGAVTNLTAVKHGLAV